MAQKSTITKIFFGTIFFLVAFFYFSSGVLAASLYLTPSTGNYFTNHTFTLGLYVSTPNAAMNAAQGTLSFPSNQLEVLSISKTNSVVNLWVQDPSFSNNDGTVNFGGVVVNPGFQGASGKILSITFRVKNIGPATVSFSSGSVLANDGKGTSILDNMRSATFALTAPSPSEGGTAKNDASSLTIVSDPPVKNGEWYNINAIKFSWTLPPATGGVNYAVSNDPGYALLHNPQGPVTSASYDLTQFSDGIWYFYLATESEGAWTSVSRVSFQLDNTPPKPFTIIQKNDNLAITNPSPVFQWDATDKASGIAYYQARIGDGDWFDPLTIIQGALYVLPLQSPTRSRSFTVRAYDHAGNFRTASTNFHTIQGCTGIMPIECTLPWFATGWNWLWLLDALLCFVFLYLLFRRLFGWRRTVRAELATFKSELRHDLRHREDRMDVRGNKGTEVDLSPATSRRERNHFRTQ